MHRIITLESVRDRLSLRDDEGINKSINSAIDAALVRVSVFLDTKFDYGYKEDLYYIDPSLSYPINGVHKLRASHGFIREDEPTTLTLSHSLDDVNIGVEEELILVDYERGWVSFPEVQEPHYAKLEYHHGYKEGVGLEEPEEAPMWLQEAVLGQVVRFMFSQQIADGSASLKEVMDFIKTNSGDILNRYSRFSSVAVNPIV